MKVFYWWGFLLDLVEGNDVEREDLKLMIVYMIIGIFRVWGLGGKR